MPHNSLTLQIMKALSTNLVKNETLKKLLHHTKNYMVGSVLSKALAVITIPILTNSITVSDYGIVSVFTSVVSVVSVILGVGIQNAITLFYNENYKQFNAFLFSNILFIVIIDGLILALIFTNKEAIANIINVPPQVISLAALVAFFTNFHQIFNAYLNISQNSSLYIKLNVTKDFGIFLGTLYFLFVLKNADYTSVLYSHLIASGFLSVIAILYLAKACRGVFKFEYVLYSLSMAAPVILHLLSAYILNTFDQLMVNKIVGSYGAGLYALLFKMGVIVQTITLSLNQAWVPILYEKLKQGQVDDIIKITKSKVVIVSAVIILAALASPFVIKLIAQPNYQEVIPYAPIILLGIYYHYLYSLYVNWIFFHKRQSVVAITTAITGALNIMLNYIFIPQYGYAAATFTTLISYALYFFITYIYAKYALKHASTPSIIDFIYPLTLTNTILLLFCYYLYHSL